MNSDPGAARFSSPPFLSLPTKAPNPAAPPKEYCRRGTGSQFFYEPVPERGTCCGLPAALSVSLSVALRAPVMVGLKVTLMVQLALAANELPQPLLCTKSPGSVPASVILVMVIAVVPTFLSRSEEHTS